jgi:hypothetical protein
MHVGGLLCGIGLYRYEVFGVVGREGSFGSWIGAGKSKKGGREGGI